MQPKILIVDSNPQNLLRLHTILEDLDAEIQEAINGYDALSITQIDDFALILIDIQLPDIDGFEVCKQLRNNSRNAQTPVIFITADYKNDNEDKIRGYAAGANDCICQPIDELVLKAKAQVFLRLFYQQYELQQADESLRIAAIAFNSQAGMVVTDPKARILRVNTAFTRLTGYSPQEAVGRTPSILKSGRHDQEFYSHLWKTLEERHYWQGEIWNRRKNGEVYPEGLTITAVVDQDNQITHYVAVFTDITERKRYEMQIRENEQRLLDMLNVSPIAVEIATHQGSNAVFYNQRYADLIKHTHPSKDPKSYYANTEDYQEILAEIARGNFIFNRQVELRTPEGSTVWALASYMPSKYHGEDAVLGWFFDITERIEAQRVLSRQLKRQRQMEDALRIANEELRAIFNAALAGIVLITDRIILRCNRKLEELFGYGPGELDGEPVRLWFPDEASYITSGSVMAKEIAEGKYQCCEQRLIRKDGSFFIARISGQALESKDPSKGVVLIIEDIAIQKAHCH